MASIEFAARARSDLRELRNYLSREAGRRVAKAIQSRIRDRVRQLAHNPRLGPAREDFGGRRALVCGPYIVIYLVETAGALERVIVLRIVHSTARATFRNCWKESDG